MLLSRITVIPSCHIGALLVLFLSLRGSRCQEKAYSPTTISYTVQQIVCNQPQFFNFITKNEETVLLDNICITFFPLPEDPTTYTFYMSLVYCDGSNSVETFIFTQSATGQAKIANPFYTFRYFNIGFIGCDTFVVYGNRIFGESSFLGLDFNFMFGFSPTCSPLGLSCLKKIKDTISQSELPDSDLYVLPMKLPNRCVTQQLCQVPLNPFYSSLQEVSVFGY